MLGIALQHMLWWGIALCCAARVSGVACFTPFS
mgnify:FL=1|jgi:hypothetical protein